MNIIFKILFCVNLFIQQNHIVVCKRRSLPPINDQDKAKAHNNSRYLPTDFLLNDKPAHLPWSIQFNVQTTKKPIMPTPGLPFRSIFPFYPPIEHVNSVVYQLEEPPVLTIETFKEPKHKPWVKYPSVSPSAEVVRPVQYPSPLAEPTFNGPPAHPEVAYWKPWHISQYPQPEGWHPYPEGGFFRRTTTTTTTAAPKTVVHTTVPPTSAAPTTEIPTSLAPTTIGPTTAPPTTILPTTRPPQPLLWFII